MSDLTDDPSPGAPDLPSGAGDRPRVQVGRELRTVLPRLAVLAVALGLLWVAALPDLARLLPARVAVLTPQLSLTVLLTLTGVGTGVALLVRPGRWPGLRVGITVLGCLPAGLLVVAAGVLAGAPVASAAAVAPLWGCVAAATTFTLAVLPAIGQRLDRSEWSN